jgi:hypothetical protein
MINNKVSKVGMMRMRRKMIMRMGMRMSNDKLAI